MMRCEYNTILDIIDHFVRTSKGVGINTNSPIPITKKPDLNAHVLRAKLAKGMGHN
uniref:Uncharacterized protein n=1 Tax=Solanum lycopersicum TaxID=4081 RepID=A0A3Q7J6Z5_SOLLC